MNLYNILFGEFIPPVSTGRITHKLDGANAEPSEREGTITSQVVAAVNRRQGLTANEIAACIGAKYSTVTNTLVRLIARRQLRRIKNGASYKYFTG